MVASLAYMIADIITRSHCVMLYLMLYHKPVADIPLSYSVMLNRILYHKSVANFSHCHTVSGFTTSL